MYHEITQIRILTESTFVLRMDRGNILFKAGQRIIAGLKGELNQREYSVYSGEKDDYLEILVREVIDGHVSVQLKECKKGQLLEVNGPFGSFGPERSDMLSGKFIFIASGTGISPFHSIVRSYPGIDYVLFHGVCYKNEAYEKDHYDPDRYILSTSRENSGGRQGRVTKFIKQYPVKPEMLFYLCGNGNMIYEVSQILREREVEDDKIFSEIYF